MERNIIYNEDCKITLKRLQDKSIDGIITSPPYNINTERSDCYYNNGYSELDGLSENDYLESCISEANPTGIIQNKRLQIEFTENTTNLIIKLKRFTSSNRKINTHITPEVILDFNTIDLEHPQDVLFILQGCIIHLGSTMRSGHYVYLVFDDSGKPQFIMSDSSITDVDDTYLTDGYIYYYRRITR